MEHHRESSDFPQDTVILQPPYFYTTPFFVHALAGTGFEPVTLRL